MESNYLVFSIPISHDTTEQQSGLWFGSLGFVGL